MAQTILVVDDSEVVRKLIELQLSKAGYSIITASDGSEGVRMARNHEPDLIIMDVQMPEMDGYEAARLIRQVHATMHTPIIMLTSLSNITSMQKGYDAGVDEYLTKPFQPNELQLRVAAMLKRFQRAQSAVQEHEIATIAVFSLRGGSGCTSLATNLAIGLTKLWDRPATLIDLAMPVGTCDVLLDMNSKHDLSAVLEYDDNAVDDELIVGLLEDHESGLRVLAGLKDPIDAEQLSENMVSSVIDSISEQSFYTVMDLPHDFGPVTLAALDKANHIIMPITPDMISIRHAMVCLRIFESLGIEKDRIHIIVNWTMSQNGLDTAMIEKHLRRKVLLTIPNVPDLWSEAINLGQPVITSEHNHPLIGLLEDVCWKFSTTADKSRKR
jgi:pilus assembly protein CpaE